MPTVVRVHVFVTFANPYLRCDACGQYVDAWHDPQKCGDPESKFWSVPCEHAAGVTSECPSWSPVDGCNCLKHLGYEPHLLRAEKRDRTEEGAS